MSDKKTPDWWQRASVVSSFVSSVVIAGVGLVISYSIQSAQIQSSKQATESAQEIERNKLATELIPHVLSDQARHRHLAVILLRQSMRAETYDEIAQVIAQDDPDPSVRSAAIQQLGRSSDRKAATALATIALDQTRPLTERTLAFQSTASVLQGALAVKCDEVLDSQECHSRFPTGCGLSGQYDAYLNLLKNQIPPPGQKSSRLLDKAGFAALEGKTPQDAARGKHAARAQELSELGEGQIVSVIGYLYAVRRGGAETANCQLSGDQNVNYHLSIGFDAAIAAQISQNDGVERRQVQQASIVAQITPHYRARYHADWDLQTLQKVVGRPVRVTGQLLFDTNHSTAHDDCGAFGANSQTCWRMSAWELTPATQLWVCRSSSGCHEGSNDWEELTAQLQP